MTTEPSIIAYIELLIFCVIGVLVLLGGIINAWIDKKH